MDNDARYDLFCNMISELDNGCDLICEYDSLLHDYHGVILYQAEAQILKMVGNQPGISAAECARILRKTLSACSQIIKKLRQKGWIHQERNPGNNRIYNLNLTEEGRQIYEKHKTFENRCYQRTYHLLDDFTDQELETYLKIQKLLNAGFAQDVDDSKQR